MIIDSEQVKLIQNNQKMYDLDAYFGKKWMKTKLKVEKKEDMPVLFYILSSKDVCKDLTSNLDCLRSFNRYKRIVKKLKSERDYNNLQATITEIEILAFYYLNHGSFLEYEPAVKVNGVTKNPDMKINIGNEVIFLEIRTIFEDRNDQTINDLTDIIRTRINGLEIPFAVDLSFNDLVSKNDFEDIEEFIVEKLTNPNISAGDIFFYEKDNVCLIEIRLRNSNGNGYVGMINGPLREREDASRLKDIILHKIKNNQLPKNSKNVLIIKGKPGSYLHTHDFENAFYGESVLHIPKNDLIPPYKDRSKNGIIHHAYGEKISLLIAYETDYNDRKFFLNPNAMNIIDEKIINKL